MALERMNVYAVLVLTVTAVPFQPGQGVASYGPRMAEDVDWYKMRDLVWYDVIDVPSSHLKTDCFNWIEFEPTPQGFRATLDVWTTGNHEKDSFILDFSRNRTGVYTLNREYRQQHFDATTNSIEHLATPENFEDLQETVYLLYELEWFFATDYDKYFIAVICTDGERISFAKSTKPIIDANDELNLLKMLRANGVDGQMAVKRQCFSINDKNQLP